MKHKRIIGVAVAVALTTFFASLIVWGLMSQGQHRVHAADAARPKVTATPSPPKKSTKKGTKPKVVYYAAMAPAGSRQFGPTQSDHRQALNKRRFKQKLREDPLFAAATIAFARDGIGFDNRAAERQAYVFAGDSKTWTGAVSELLKSVKSYSIVYDGSSSYTTRGMVPHGSKRPRLFTATEHRSAGWTLVLHLRNGHTRALRIACGFQPVGHPHRAKAKVHATATTTKATPAKVQLVSAPAPTKCYAAAPSTRSYPTGRCVSTTHSSYRVAIRTRSRHSPPNECAALQRPGSGGGGRYAPGSLDGHRNVVV